MPYDLRMPDGTMIKDIPDEVDPKVAASSYVDQIFAASESRLEAEPDISGWSPGKRAAAGVGKGATDVYENVKDIGYGAGNLFGLVDDETVARRDEEMAMRDERDRVLSEDEYGMAGEFTGELVASAPAGGAMRGVLAGASRLPQASSLAARVLGSTPAKMAVEGAATGAVVADDAAEGALLGGGLGGTLGAGGKLVSAVAKRGLGGLIKQSDEAAKVFAETGESLPVAMAAESEGTRSVFSNIIPFLPGFDTAKQVTAAKEVLKKAGLKHASPSKMFDAADADDLAVHFTDEYSRAAGKIGRVRMEEDFLTTGAKRVDSKVNNIVNEYIDGGKISGESYRTIRERLARLEDANITDEAYDGIVDAFDTRFKQHYRTDGNTGRFRKNVDIDADLADLTEVNEGYDAFRDILKGADELLGGDMAQTRVKSKGIFQKLAAHAVVKNVIGAMAGGGAAASGGVGAGVAGTMAGLGALTTSRPGQKVLLGNTGVQEGIRKALSEGPTRQFARQAGMMGTRAGAVGEADERNRDGYRSY